MPSFQDELIKICDLMAEFLPEKSGQFCCPLCLVFLNEEELYPFPSEISKASVEHIIPDNASGKIKTIICKSCNSNLGKAVSKWLGYYFIHYHDSLAYKRPDTDLSKSKIQINGIKLVGKVFYQDGIATARIPTYRADKSGKIKKYLNNKFELDKLNDVQSGSTVIEYECPNEKLYAKENYIKIGLLGAAYLMWFKVFGYSFVFQENMHIIRKILYSPEKFLPPDGWFFDVDDDDNAIGFAVGDGMLFPVANVYGKGVILPSHLNGDPPKEDKEYIYFWLNGEGLTHPTAQCGAYPHALLFDKYPVFVPNMIGADALSKLVAVNYDSASGEFSTMVQAGPEDG